jgi:hypothetical protein
MYEEELNEAQNPPPWIGARKASAIALAMGSRWHYWTTENVRAVTSQPMTDEQAALLAAACNAEDPHGLDYKTLSTVFANLKEGYEL